MTVLVHGAGAVGSLFAARLAAAGVAVHLTGRAAHVTAIERDGLRVDGVGAMTVTVRASTKIPAGLRPEAVLVTVKTFDLPAAAREAGEAVPPAPLLLPQNGLEIERPVLAVLSSVGWSDADRYVVRAVDSIPATLVRPGVVRAAGHGELILPELPPDDPRRDAVDRFARLFRTAGVAVRSVPAFERELWRKALVNAAINPVTALHRVPNGALATGEPHREAERLLNEARAAAAAAGIPFSPGEAAADLDRVVRATAENRSSMLQDVERGRPTEIEAISGALLRLGTAHGIAMPATRAVIDRIRSAAVRTGQPS